MSVPVGPRGRILLPWILVQDATLVSTSMACGRCGAPLAPHRFGLTARCPYCLTTSMIDRAGVDAALFAESSGRMRDATSRWMGEVVARGSLTWTPLSASSSNGAWRVVVAASVTWPSQRALIVKRSNGAPVDSAAIHAIEGIAHAARRVRHPALPQVIDSGAGFAAMCVGFSERVVMSAGAVLPPQPCVWVLVRLLEFAAWCEAFGYSLQSITAADLVFATDEHSLSVLVPPQPTRASNPQVETTHAVALVRALAPAQPELEALFSEVSQLAPLPASAMARARGRAMFGATYAPLSRFHIT